MANILDYLQWRGDLLLTERPFNSVDNLILSVLAYTDLKGIVPPEGGILLADAAARYAAEGRDQSHQACDPKEALMAAAGSARFRNARLSAYADRTDTEAELQFSAVTFTLDDGSLYVAYRGTDNSIVGWREDFNMGWRETPGQLLAVEYLNRCGAGDAPLRIGGHSKGGNFAAFAAACCDASVQQRITRVYNNDGPGFLRGFLASDGYRRILGRLELLLPENSLIGILLRSGTEGRTVKSSASGFQQHNPYTWQVLGTDFETVEKRSGTSTFVDETVDQWLDRLSDTERQHFVAAVFDSLEASGVSTLTELNANRKVTYNAVLKAASELEPDTQKDFFRALKSLAATGTDLLWAEAKKALDRWSAERRSQSEDKKNETENT